MNARPCREPDVIEIARVWPKPFVVAAVLACLACGMGLALWPLATSVALVSVVTLSLFVTGERGILKAFLLFLLIQDVLQVVAGGDTSLGLIIKRSDEPMVLVFGTLCILFSTAVQRSFRSRGLLLSLAACYAGLVLSSLPPHAGLTPSLLDLALFSKPFFLFAIGMSIVPTDSEIERSLRPLLCVMLAVIGFGIVFLVAPHLQDAYIGAVRAPDERLGLLSAQGFFIGPGTYSWFAAATFALAYAAYLAYSRTFYLGASVFAAGFTILSWRRKSILAVLTILLVSLIARTSRATRVRALGVAVLSVAIAATLLAPYVAGLWRITETEYGGDNPNRNARSALYHTSVLIARDHFPLGAGLASFGSHASKLYYSEVYSHYGISEVYGLSPRDANFITDTFWPMVLGEGGVVSLVAYASLFWLLLTASWRAARRKDQTPTGSLVALTALFVLVGSLVESTASHIYGSALQAVLAMVPAGILWERERRRVLAIERSRYAGTVDEEKMARRIAGN